MILIEVWLPCIPEVLEFFAEEDITVADMKAKMLEILSNSYQIQGKPEEYLLLDRDGQRILLEDMLLPECGIRAGSRIVMI